MQEKNLEFGAAGLPVDFRKDEATFSDGLRNCRIRQPRCNEREFRA